MTYSRRMPDPQLLYLGSPCKRVGHRGIRYRSAGSCLECVTKPWSKEVLDALVEQLRGPAEAA